MKGKKHLRVTAADMRDLGQSEHEYTHQSACGYIRDNVTNNYFEVTCFYCKRTPEYDYQENNSEDIS